MEAPKYMVDLKIIKNVEGEQGLMEGWILPAVGCLFVELED